MGLLKIREKRFARWPNTLKLLLNGDAPGEQAFPRRTRQRSPLIVLPQERIQLSLKEWPRWQLHLVPLTPTRTAFPAWRSSMTSWVRGSKTVKLEACPWPAETTCPRTCKRRCTNSSLPIAVRVPLVSLRQALEQESLLSDKP